MGVVWRARDDRLHRTVAVKQLLPQTGFDDEEAEDARLRAMREGRIAAKLQHPNAVSVYDVVEDDGLPWLIMEYVPSRSLAAVLAEQRVMPPYQVARIGAQVAAALAAAHSAGVVHRDVKPANVLLAEDGRAMITDFGISRAVDDVVVTATGMVSGTPAYLAPEMAKGEQPVPASDVFALGSTLYTAVEGEPPFGRSDNPLALLHWVAAGRITPPSQAGPLTAVLLRLLELDPARRPSMQVARDALAEVAGERTVDSVEPVERAAPRGPFVEPVAPFVDPPIRIPGPESTLTSLDMALAQLPLAKPSRPRRRLRARVVALMVVAVLAVAGIGLLALRNLNAGNGVAAGAVQTTPPTSSVPPTTPAGPVNLARMRTFLIRYYGLLPGDTAQAWQLLSPDYRVKAGGMATFNGFWATIRAVRVHDIVVGRRIDMANGVVTFTKRDGMVVSERWTFTVMSRNGQLVIANADRLGDAV